MSTMSTNETPTRRLSFAAADGTSTPPPTPETGTGLQKTIAETRQQIVGELKEEIQRLNDALRTSESHVTELEKFVEARDETIRELNLFYTDLQEKHQQLLEDTSTVKDQDVEQGTTEAEEITQARPATNLFTQVEEFLAIHQRGPQGILATLEAKGAIERAGYLAHIGEVAKRLDAITGYLADLRKRAVLAAQIIGD